MEPTFRNVLPLHQVSQHFFISSHFYSFKKHIVTASKSSFVGFFYPEILYDTDFAILIVNL